MTARTSAFAFRGQDVDVRDIGARLGVDHVLEGSVRRASNRLRITAQLIQVTDGCHVWSERYDRELTDVFALQDELAQAISDRLRPELAGDRRLVKTPTANVEAYQLYLQGRYHFCKMSPEGFARGRQCFEQAIAADPEFALAYDSLSELFWYLGFFGLMPPKDAFSKSVWATLRSLEIDDTLAEAHALLGMLRKELDYNWPEVQREFQRALELNPASPVVRLRYALSGLMPLGRVDQAAQELEGVLQSDPLSLFARWCLALMYYLGGRLDLALQQAQQMLEVDSTYAPAYWSLGTGYEAKGRFEDAVVAFQKYFELSGGLSANLGWLGWIYGRAGNETKARATLAELETRSQVSYVPPSSLAWTHLGLGEFDSAFACWAKAIEVRDPHIIPFKTYPFLAPLRSDPRYRELLRTMNLEP